MKQISIILLLALIASACNSYLEVKPDMSITVPESIEDIRGILDNQYEINDNLPGLADISADDYFVDYTTWKSRPVRDQGLYVWDGNLDTYHVSSWNTTYHTIMIANVALETIDRIKGKYPEQSLNNLKGEALFIRAFMHFLIAQLYCGPYVKDHENNDQGIPIRKSSDLNIKSFRSTIAESYNEIIKDLVLARDLLPTTSESITRPSRIAANALLSRVYLSTQEYDKSLLYSQEALKGNNKLLDYNELSTENAVPFQVKTNSEIIYFGQNVAAGTFITKTRANIDTVLYGMYSSSDLRKSLFFEKKSNGNYAYKGHYSGIPTNLFNGLALDEIYLNISECLVRKKEVLSALSYINKFLETRYKQGEFSPLEIQDGDKLLKIILEERRKQLIFRGIRWMDLRRLNLDDRFMTTIYRKLFNGKIFEEYILPPNDLRYIQLIPLPVIETSNIEQNRR